MDLGLDWQQLLLWGTGLSVLAMIGTIIGVPWVVTRLPHDYFSRPQRAAWRETADEPVFALLLGVCKNFLGALLVLLGLVLLVTPGQGFLTLLLGLLMMNFPGKYQLERWLVQRPGVLRALNWLRGRRNQVPFDTPAE
ncbi:MAG: hypothetical protein DRR04_06385 [Gammaproteobacteria bacterium]|nr:MAG: hypothetical protein DRQ97_07730 [Gammaproteobacteria bacterium]RLA60177.1 MAG: hypothetical protein DRR04_06385 [Gammaproteobacteria bacterium]